MKVILAVMAGACYSAAYVCTDSYTTFWLILSSGLVLVMRGI